MSLLRFVVIAEIVCILMLSNVQKLRLKLTLEMESLEFEFKLLNESLVCIAVLDLKSIFSLVSLVFKIKEKMEKIREPP